MTAKGLPHDARPALRPTCMSRGQRAWFLHDRTALSLGESQARFNLFQLFCFFLLGLIQIPA